MTYPGPWQDSVPQWIETGSVAYDQGPLSYTYSESSQVDGYGQEATVLANAWSGSYPDDQGPGGSSGIDISESLSGAPTTRAAWTLGWLTLTQSPPATPSVILPAQPTAVGAVGYELEPVPDGESLPGRSYRITVTINTALGQSIWTAGEALRVMWAPDVGVIRYEPGHMSRTVLLTDYSAFGTMTDAADTLTVEQAAPFADANAFAVVDPFTWTGAIVSGQKRLYLPYVHAYVQVAQRFRYIYADTGPAIPADNLTDTPRLRKDPIAPVRRVPVEKWQGTGVRRAGGYD